MRFTNECDTLSLKSYTLSKQNHSEKVILKKPKCDLTIRPYENWHIIIGYWDFYLSSRTKYSDLLSLRKKGPNDCFTNRQG